MKKQNGFTLIEIFVVISIITFLMGMTIPCLRLTKEQSRAVRCQTQLKNMGLAMSLYCEDAEEYYPFSDMVYFNTLKRLPGESASGTFTYIHQRWYNRQVNLKANPDYQSQFVKYLENTEVLLCPTFQHLARAKGASLSSNVIWWGQQDDRYYQPQYNYTMNGLLGVGPRALARKRIQVKNPAHVFVFTEEGPYVVQGVNTTGLNDSSLWVLFEPAARAAIAQCGGKEQVKPGLDTTFGTTFVDSIAGFHSARYGDVTSGKGYATFADGHVGAVTREDSFRVAWPQ